MNRASAPPAVGARLHSAAGQEWLVLRTTLAEDDPDVWLVHVIKAADDAAGLRHLSLVMNGDEYREFCRDQGIA